MNMTTKMLSAVLLTGFSLTLQAQTEVRTEAQYSATSGDHTPLWLNANKYGLSSLNTSNGYVRAGLFHSMEADSAKRWAIGYGADVAIASGYTSTLVVQQAYADIRWLKGLLTIGSKEQPMELKNQELSSGSQTLGINARPIPSVRLSLPNYWTVPYTRGWLGIKGHIAYGMQTDDNWQKDFSAEFSKRTEHAKIHTKAGYLRIGKEGKPISVELGLEMACQYGGTTYTINPYPTVPGTREMVAIKNKDGVSGMVKALIPGGGEVGEGVYDNASGNHLGSYLLRVNMDYDKWYLGLYADHFFEDHSQMFFLDYDGYGQGDEYNEWKESRWLVYDLKDMMLGAELKLKDWKWVNNFVVEYIYTKYQSGPIYHDRTRYLSDHIAGRDNYYNNYMQTGWQHWGQVMGNPLYRSPLYNDNQTIEVANNRFWAWHFGLSGDPTDALHYRVLATWQRGWGTYDAPLPEPERNMSLLAEAEYRFSEQHQLAGWSVKAAFGLDHGGLLGNNTGGQLTISKRFNIKKK
jgi:hypothetical protein